MILQTYTSMEIGQPISSQCKPQNLNSHFNSRVLLGFNLHTTKHSFTQRKVCKSQLSSKTNHPLHRNIKILQPHKQKPQENNKDRVFVGFKLHCHSKTEPLPSRTVINGKKKGYGGILPSILRALRTESDVEKTLDLYFGKLSPKEQTVILKEQSNWEKALRVFEWMKSQKDYVPNVIHYNVILRALGRAKKWDELRLCWIEMAKNSVFPTNNTYGMLVDVYGKAGLVKEALLWIKHMKLRGIFPDEVTMNTVVKVLKDAGEYDRADKFYKDWCAGKIELDDLDFESIDDSEPFSLKQFLLTELFRTGGRNPSRVSSLSDVENNGRKPRMTATYNTLIDLYGKAGRLKDAANVFNEMLKSGVALDAFTFNTMIFICGSHGYLEESEALLNKMDERGISPDTKTYNIFLSLYANAGKIDRALQWYRKIRGTGLFPDAVTCRAIIKILCKQNMILEVENVISEIESLGMYIDEHSLPVIMRMYVNEGLIDRAKAIFEKCQLNGGFSSPAYAAIIDVYADKGLWVEAEDVFFGKRDKFIQKKAIVEYNVMIKAYGVAKLYDKAFSLFKGMKSQGTWPDECTYNSLIQMFSGGDLVDQAKELLVEMQGLKFKPSCSTFSAVIASYVRMSRLSDAVDVFDEMSKAGVKPNEVVYGSLIDGFAEAGKFEEAMHYFHVMNDSGIQANQIILTSMIKAYSKLGSVEGAKKLYERMKNLHGGPDIIASNSMLNLYADFGMVSEAKMIFNHLREKGEADGVTFATLIYAYKNMGMLDEAIEIAEDMKQSGLLRDCMTFNKVMACYATNGQLVECGELLNEMINQKLLPDGGTFKVLFTILKKGGFSAEAVRQLELSYREGKPYARQAVIISVYSAVGLHAFAIESCHVITQPGLGLHPFAYNVAIYAYGASGQIDEALKIFMRMQDEGLEPDIVTFVNLVGCYGKAGMVEGIKRIYGQLKYGIIEANESLYEAIIDAYGDAGRYDLADLVSQEMKLDFEVKQLTDSESEGGVDEVSEVGEGEDSEG
ncbi:pentatricopeptide repeat-containing protein At1g73710 [Lycium ferocissimum]|uniref:pentatricopeptide repeat-containing protein At1g73710 n=1 Tax=Lycium ferocissimum TaxID=112874 RepID=UPI0028151003|nr:pentatricopeptide repeat-containing protein At1g73710 [Lycium ferocissimum]XP_059312746.1 pentatricopeptide repeat-containing protein At1g73710 [Lycium ferocissimum]XP_059312747.1 pentatricopeptide repeat-containing protein At1g73710 [Lycium ferocissimum]XP_059312748.1 pentatricopeptide repeat-containing protein At1g73710 [Lycium ferocissimum]XP_059312749.1 pentatricopeptide repeat-containing protein At1g73710 [Lycium ferocissimum]XP_059312750.1 pentatricopeptide repeat-containing protein A